MGAETVWGKPSYDIRQCQYWGIGRGGGGRRRGRVRGGGNKKKKEKGTIKKKQGSIGLPPVGIPGMARGVRDESMASIAQ